MQFRKKLVKFEVENNIYIKFVEILFHNQIFICITCENNVLKYFFLNNINILFLYLFFEEVVLRNSKRKSAVLNKSSTQFLSEILIKLFVIIL